MTERELVDAPATARTATPAQTPFATQSPHARLLELQRRAGNRALGRMLQRSPNATSAATTTTARQWFEQRMQERWGVPVRAGTEADQVAEMRRMTPASQASPSSIGAWTAWDPGPASDIYGDIDAGFDQMASVLRGISEVRELRFLDTDYENRGGTAHPEPGHGATYSAGLLQVFRRLETANWPLPEGRSTTVVKAPITTGSRSDGRRRIIVHELCHGIFERFGTPGQPGAEANFFTNWGQAAGWTGGQIVQSGTPLDTTNWNDPWPEQPVSAYSLQNLMEDFCESLMCYIDRKEVLRTRSPGRFDFIDSRVSGWRPYLRAPDGPVYTPGDYELPPDGGTRYA